MKSKKATKNKAAVVLLSGGLDSAVALYMAKDQGFLPLCLVFDYGQRHKREIASAKALAKKAGCRLTTIRISLPWKGSALLDKKSKLRSTAGPLSGETSAEIPASYVPARNIIFLSFALSYAEAMGASAIFIGAHAQDYSGYPDCRPRFYSAFRKAAKEGTKAGIQARAIKILSPLINMTKAKIIEAGKRLEVPFELTWSCYNGKNVPCGKCDSCYFRAKGFKDAGFIDPLLDKRQR